jgi:hypothetical protein
MYLHFQSCILVHEDSKSSRVAGAVAGVILKKKKTIGPDLESSTFELRQED